MTPTEDELRAALRRGAGTGHSGPRADDIVRAAQQARAARRRRATGALAAAGCAVVVGGVAAGITLSGHTGHTGHTGGGGSAAAAAGTAAHAESGSGPATPCPAAPPNLVTPLGQVPGRSGPVLPADVTRLTLCLYSDAQKPTVRTLGAADAATVAATVNALPTQKLPCPLHPPDGEPVLVLLPETAAGQAAPVVASNVECGRITNGTETRFGVVEVNRLAAVAGGATPS